MNHIQKTFLGLASLGTIITSYQIGKNNAEKAAAIAYDANIQASDELQAQDILERAKNTKTIALLQGEVARLKDALLLRDHSNQALERQISSMEYQNTAVSEGVNKLKVALDIKDVVDEQDNKAVDLSETPTVCANFFKLRDIIHDLEGDLDDRRARFLSQSDHLSNDQIDTLIRHDPQIINIERKIQQAKSRRLHEAKKVLLTWKEWKFDSHIDPWNVNNAFAMIFQLSDILDNEFIKRFVAKNPEFKKELEKFYLRLNTVWSQNPYMKESTLCMRDIILPWLDKDWVDENGSVK